MFSKCVKSYLKDFVRLTVAILLCGRWSFLWHVYQNLEHLSVCLKLLVATKTHTELKFFQPSMPLMEALGLTCLLWTMALLQRCLGTACMFYQRSCWTLPHRYASLHERNNNNNNNTYIASISILLFSSALKNKNIKKIIKNKNK